MSDLVAQGPKLEDNWRRPLPAGETIVLGRDPAAWGGPWEPYLSRRHAELIWRHGKLKVRRLPGAANPVFHNGDAADSFEVAPDGGFVIGHTVFTVAATQATPSPAHGRVLLEARTIGHT